jgi:integrase
MGRLPSGTRRKGNRLEKRFTVNGKRYSVYGYTVAEIVEAEAKKRSEIERGVLQANISLDCFFERWTERRKDHVREATIITNETRYKRISNYVFDKSGRKFGELYIKDITVEHLRQLQRGLKEQVSTCTSNQAIKLIKQIFNTAYKERCISWDPCGCIDYLKDNKPKATDTIHRALTREETKKFLKYAEDSYYKNVFLFALYSGCRIGEIASLKYSDIKGDSISIQRTTTKTKGEKYFTIGETTKTPSGVRTIPLTPELKAIIQDQQAIQRVYKVRSFDDVVFKNSKGAVISARNVNGVLRSICEKANIEYFSVHALRDTYATRAIESGINPKTLQKLMGHSSINMTMDLYCQVMEETKQQEIKLLSII